MVNFHREIRLVQQPLDPLAEYPDRFDNALGMLPCSYEISLNPDVDPVIRPPHRVSFAMKDRVESTLRDMVATGILKEVSEPTQWVSTMVVAAKKDKSELRICINPKDLNMAIKRPHYPMRTVEDVAAQVGPATVFSVLDAKSSFWQIPLDQQSSYLTTFATPFGRFRFLRMPFGISSASEVFQRTMEQLFVGLPCAIIVDDILVYGKDVEQHDHNLRLVLDRAREVNLKLNPSKCRFRVPEVTYVGHVFTASGLKPDPQKTAAISEMPAPVDVPSLQRFRDGVLGSPAQRLMSRVTRPPIPVAQQTLAPAVVKPAVVRERIATKQSIQKRSHDRSSRALPPLSPGQVVRMRSTSGLPGLAVVVGTAGSPRSYLVNLDGTVYRRSRRHLRLVNEPPPPPPADPHAPPLSALPPVVVTQPVPTRPVPVLLPVPAPVPPAVSPPSPGRSPPVPLSPRKSPHRSPPVVGSPPVPVPLGGEGVSGVRTRSGRIVRAPDRYGDYI